MKNTAILILISILITSCSINDDNFSISENKKFLVSKVFDYQNRLLADYIYNDNNQLTKRIFTDPTTGNSSDLMFSYTDNKVSQIEFIDHNYPNFNNNKFLFYDSSDRIVRSEIFQNGNMISHINYEYSSSGLITHFYSDDGITYNFFEYDNHRNIITVTNFYFDPFTGGNIEHISQFNYDYHRKPSFNLDYLFQIDLLPKMGSEAVFERNMSLNNLTFSENSGTRWSYTYNDSCLPVSILTEWEGIITDEPILLRLEYIEQ